MTSMIKPGDLPLQDILATDIDQVLAQFLEPYLAFLNRYYGKNIPIDGLSQFELGPLFGITLGESRQRIYEFSQGSRLLTLKTIPGAKKGMRRLKDEFTNYAVTARPDYDEPDTKAFLRSEFPCCIAGVLFSSDYHPNSPRKTKAELCRDLNARLLLEDSRKIANDFAEIGGRSILLDYPWNQGTLHERVTRVYSWLEIVDTAIRMKRTGMLR